MANLAQIASGGCDVAFSDGVLYLFAMHFFVILLLIPFLFGGDAGASSPTSNVGSAVVNQGLSDIDTRYGLAVVDTRSGHDQRWRLQQHFDYGFTDWYAFRLIAQQTNRAGGHFEHQSLGVENRFQLIERRDYGWDGAANLIYTQADGDKTPHKIDLRLLANVPFAADWEWRFDGFIDHDLGANSVDGLTLELRNRVMKHFTPDSSLIDSYQIGAEIFTNFGRIRNLSGYSAQNHQLGPMMRVNLENGGFIQSAYRAGISSDAPDHSFGLFLGYRF